MSDSSDTKATPETAATVATSHPLQTEWTFWYERKPQASHAHSSTYKEYQNSVVKLGSFNTLEGFWQHYSNLSNPDAIPKDYSLFLSRNQTTPAWESYPNGGMWIIRVFKKNTLIDRLWEELCFACVGELFGHPDVVCVGVSTRAREDVITVWNRDNVANDQLRYAIGDRLKDILNLDDSTQIDYKTFRSAIRDGSSFRNAVPHSYSAQAQYPAGIALPPQFMGWGMPAGVGGVVAGGGAAGAPGQQHGGGRPRGNKGQAKEQQQGKEQPKEQVAPAPEKSA